MGYPGEPDMFNHVGNLRACSWGRWVPVGLSVPIQGVHLQKEASVFKGPLILAVPVLGFQINLDQLENEAIP